MCGPCRTLAILPVIFAALCVLAVLANYLLATLVDHDVYPLIPNIDETDDKHPLSNVYSQLFNICSVVLLVIVFVRYLQVKYDGEWNEESRPLVNKLNQVGLLFGVLVSVGGSLLANFQTVSTTSINEKVKTVHLIGAAMVLFCGVTYCWLQTVISYKMKLCGLNSTCLFNTRAVCTVMVSVFAVICLTCKELAEEKWLEVPHNKTTGKWDPKDAGFVPHAIGNSTEWVVAVILLTFILTFIGEFKNIRIKMIVSRFNMSPVPLSVSNDESMRPLLM